MADGSTPPDDALDCGEAPYLVIGSGGFAGQRFPLESDEIVIGRNPGTDITLIDEGLSREHAVILRDPQTGVFSIEDLQSSNGTKVNGKRVRSAELCHNDEITLGLTTFRFLEPGLPLDPALQADHDDNDDTLAYAGAPDLSDD
ncbi:MAG TPA: FHA domain-containing protein [Myxococcota bacterium]|nr:FHA domain-containing protein [Myxococcota bacterium]